MERMTVTELAQTVECDGHELTIVATRHGDDEWSLAIQNEHRIQTAWTEYFESGEAAMEAGRKAIAEEGIESFISTEGFEYMFEPPVVPCPDTPQ